MREIINVLTDDILPKRDDVLEMQGIPSGNEPSESTKKIFERSLDLFLTFARPIGLVADISIPAFQIAYAGEGLNEKQSPLETVTTKADHLALFATTVGKEITKKITELFKKNEFALGNMLDTAASVGAEKAADCVERFYCERLKQTKAISSSSVALRYSPGYCGWHISGQKKLFDFLHPEDIGVTLLESYLMNPLKSVSGVLVIGKREIHLFDDSYPVCDQCETHSCRERMKALLAKTNSKEGGV